MKSNNQEFVILLHGTKGAGKTTVNEILKKKMEAVAFFGLDVVRRLIINIPTNNETNAIANDVMMEMIDEFLKNNISIVLDSGLTKDRLESIYEICNKHGVKINKYFLTAPKDELWKRVKKREIEGGKSSNKERFDYVYDIVYESKFNDFVEIDTSKNNPEEVADIIMEGLK